jgi:hypothetical protein
MLNTQRAQSAIPVNIIDVKDSLGSSILEIVVGEETKEQKLLVHADLFTRRSKILKSMISTADEAWPKSPVSFPGYDPETFRLYISLVYTGVLPTRGSGEWLKLCRLYVLAEKLQDIQTKNTVIDAVHACVTEWCREGAARTFQSLHAKFPADMGDLISIASITELWEGTPANSPARRFILDLYASHGKSSWLIGKGGTPPRDFLLDLTLALMKARPTDTFCFILDRPSSIYHHPFEAGDESKKHCKGIASSIYDTSSPVSDATKHTADSRAV